MRLPRRLDCIRAPFLPAQDEVLSSWHLAEAVPDGPHPELVEGRTSSMHQRSSMRLSRHGSAALADEEVEIGALMRLHDMLDIEPGIAAVVTRGRRFPGLAALRQFSVAHIEMEP